jgi:hypothetical protein
MFGMMSSLCRQLFKDLKILPLKSQYIFSLLLFVAKNRDSYELNSEIHNIVLTLDLVLTFVLQLQN